MEQISLLLFGTSEYQEVLDAMSPSDTIVKEFWHQCKLAGVIK